MKLLVFALFSSLVSLAQTGQSELICPEVIDKSTCVPDFESSLSPESKQSGWKVLFEARYAPTNMIGERPHSIGRLDFEEGSDLLNYRRQYLNRPVKDLTNVQDFQEEFNSLSTGLNSQLAEELKAAMVLEQLQRTADYDSMMKRMQSLMGVMNDDEYLQFLVGVAGYVDYNTDRSKFIQEEGAGLGRVGPFEQIIGTSSGVCGDIHSMVAKFAEQKGWEAFTVGYALEGSQHVVTAVVNPNEPNKLMIVNYGTYEEEALNDGNSVVPAITNHNGMNEMGIQLRIFKNDQTGADGKMQQIATVPTALGSFMNTLFDRHKKIQGGMVQNQNFNRESIALENTKQKVVEKNNGDIKERMINHGMMVYEGRVGESQIYGIAVSRDVLNTLYDVGVDGKCVPKKDRFFSLGLTGGSLTLPMEDIPQNYFVYLNMRGGVIHHIFQTEHFQFKGVLGYELEAFSSFKEGGEFLTADAHFRTFAGVVSEFQNKGWNIRSSVTLETQMGLKNQNLMTDLSALPENLNPISFNALNVNTNVSKQMDDKNTLTAGANFTLTRVGSYVILSTGLIHQNTVINLSYQGGMKALPVGNSLQQVNLLQNFNQMDGVRITVGQNFSNKKGTLSGNAAVWGGLSTGTPTVQPFVGGTLKINIGGNKKKKTKPTSF